MSILLIIIGLPLILVGLGFFLLMLTLYRGRESQVNRQETIELARTLDRTLNQMENRLTAIEDIVLQKSGGKKNEL